MNWFIILSLYFIWNFQEYHCCMKWKRSADDCECSDILDLMGGKDRANLPTTEKVGCVRNITCDDDVQTYVTISFNASEIVGPDDNVQNFGFVVSTDQSGELSGPLDIFSSFGMFCENKKWYVNIYPFGLSYRTKDWKRKYITGDWDGKKSEIQFIACSAFRWTAI